MNLRILLLCLLVMRCSSSLGAYINNIDKLEGRIVGGHMAQPHSHPYIVSLQLRFLWVRTHICAGSILNERWVLTAAHCLDSFIIRWLTMDAVAGAHHVNDFGPTAQVTKIIDRIEHPNYKGGIAPYDIAVLQTQDRFVFNKEVQPIRLPKSVDMSNPALVLPGWGALRTTTFIPDLPNYLQELDVTYVPHELCYEKINRLLEKGEENPLVENVHICTGPLTGGKAACNGDSGGPLVLRENNSEETANGNKEETADNQITNRVQSKKEFTPVVIGIVSWGISPCGEEDAPTVYTNVTEYLDFINSYIHH